MSKLRLILKSLFVLMIFISSALSYTPQYTNKDKNIPLRWSNKKIPITISNSLLDKSINIKAKSNVLETIKKSLEHWEEVADIEFTYNFSDKESVSDKSSSGDGVSLITIAPTSENLLLFDEKIEESSAMTRLFFNTKGEIKEADIVLNPILLFTTDGTFGTFDLEATLTHEIGHLLGLGHSQIIGSTMHSHQGKNGIYNLPGFSSRTLSEDDKAGAVSLYGSRQPDLCCGKIEGKLTITNPSISKQLEIWVEDSQTGKVIAGISTDANGNFVLDGLPNSVYRIYAQSESSSYSTISLGEIDLREGGIKKLNKEIRLEPKNFEASYVGFNGQLSSLTVPVNAGKSYIIYVGGKNLSPNNVKIGFHSTNFKVNSKSLIKHNYSENISVISFEVEIDELTPVGEYSFFIKSHDGNYEYLVGGVSVENTTNPWDIKVF